MSTVSSTSERFWLLSALLMALTAGCAGLETGPAPLTAKVPLHLEEHLDKAHIEGSEVQIEVLDVKEWRFDEPQRDWKAADPIPEGFDPVEPVRVDDALRVPMTEVNRRPGSRRLLGSVYVELPDWNLEDWSFVEIRARTADPMRFIGLEFNYAEEDSISGVLPYYSSGDRAPLVTDGTAHTYRLSLDWAPMRQWKGPWTHLGIWFNGGDDLEQATLDLLSVSIIPRDAAYAHAPVGVRTEVKSEAHRRTIYTHAPGRLEYQVRVPEAGRLDLGLGVLQEGVPVSFRITAEPEGGSTESLLEETYADKERWAQRSVDLSHLGGANITLALEADADKAGTVALWAAPTLTGARATEKPNIIFYVIDGGAADHMSLYGYNRRTTPHLERLAAEGAVFEHAYSNATWTQPSTSSFMTSLHTSALGSYKGWGDPMIPEEQVTMAHHLHRAGYQTAVFTSNTYAGTGAALERDGVDVLRDVEGEFNSTSSAELHEDYWSWREAYPGAPYWVHFQTTDMHWAWSSKPVPPFAGLYVNPELQERYLEWDHQLEEAGGRQLAAVPNSAALAEAGIDPIVYSHARRGLYDEAMAHQDYQLGQLVERLKAEGEWQNTLLIVGSDHGGVVWVEGYGDQSLTPYDPMFRSSETRIPLLVFWPGRIAGGQRFSQPVSMIDVLPTILDLVDLPMPEVMQGQSLAPLLLGQEGWEPRPVILDEFYTDEISGEISGVIEVVDGRWGASLEINPHPDREPETQRTVPLLLYDLWNDPYTQHSLHEERPDLVEKYTAFLEAQFNAHQALAQRFTSSGETALTTEQLQTLRALGYIQ